MANCSDTLNELHRFLDNELPADIVSNIMGHLSSCTDCQQAFEFHADLKRIISEKAKRDEIPDGLLDKLQGCFGDVFVTEEPAL